MNKRTKIFNKNKTNQKYLINNLHNKNKKMIIKIKLIKNQKTKQKMMKTI